MNLYPQEAIEAKSFYDVQREIKTGSVKEGFDQSDHIVTGELHIGGQEHFYLETNAILVVPKEDGEMEIFNSTQSAHLTQMQIAKVTGIPSNKIVVRVKRMGRYNSNIFHWRKSSLSSYHTHRWRIWWQGNTFSAIFVCSCHSSKEVSQ